MSKSYEEYSLQTPQGRKSLMKAPFISYGIVVQVAIDVLVVLLTIMLVNSCSAPSHIQTVRDSGITAKLTLPTEPMLPESQTSSEKRDTLTVANPNGKELIIMKAVKDENGEMVATDKIDAAVVTARFRHIAERNGLVNLEFQIRVPEELIDDEWQLRFYPKMHILGDTLHMKPVLITGAEYRRFQLRGYEQYERFLSSIVTDSARFINIRQLEIFIERNIPTLYAFKTDSTYVSDRDFTSAFGVTEQETIEHYTNKIARSLNERRKASRDKMYEKYVRAPIDNDGPRLDTVVRAGNGDFIYNYSQQLMTRPHLKKVEITLRGEIFNQDVRIYIIPEDEPITFYISSLCNLADNSVRQREDGSIDTLYMEGLQAIQDRDFKKAVTILRPYKDYNAAIAYSAMDYNASARAILETLPESAGVDYLLALIYSRQGEESKAVEMFLKAVRLKPAYINRANLDPEISTLVKSYDIDTQYLNY